MSQVVMLDDVVSCIGLCFTLCTDEDVLVVGVAVLGDDVPVDVPALGGFEDASLEDAMELALVVGQVRLVVNLSGPDGGIIVQAVRACCRRDAPLLDEIVSFGILGVERTRLSRL